jgi:hypothetical protein
VIASPLGARATDSRPAAARRAPGPLAPTGARHRGAATGPRPSSLDPA